MNKVKKNKVPGYSILLLPYTKRSKSSTRLCVQALNVTFYFTFFSIPDIINLDKLLIKLTKHISCHIPISFANILTEFPRYTFPTLTHFEKVNTLKIKLS